MSSVGAFRPRGLYESVAGLATKHSCSAEGDAVEMAYGGLQDMTQAFRSTDKIAERYARLTPENVRPAVARLNHGESQG